MNDTTGSSQTQSGIDPSPLPAALRATPRWVTHRTGSKQPYYVNGRPRSGKLDSERDTAQLASFEDAAAAVAASAGGLGLGFALGAGWHGGDLDDCRDPVTGALTSWAKVIIEACGTYVEVSQSGKGLHVLTYDKRVTYDALGSNGSGAEFYSKARYFIVTGNCLMPAPSKWPRAGNVRALFEERWSNGKAARQGPERRGNYGPGVLPAGGASLEWPDFARQLAEGLMRVPPGRPRDRWLAIGMGIHYESGGSIEGFALWHAWSSTATDGSYTGDADLLRQWNSFKTSHAKPVTWGTVRKYLDEFAPKPEPLPETVEGALPFVDILVEPVERAPIIEGWLYERVVLLQAADGGSGKSYLSLLEAMMVALGHDCYLGLKVSARRVLLYSGEDDADVIRGRMRRYCKYFGWRMEDLRANLAIVDRSETDCVLYTEERGFTEEYARLVKTVTGFDPGYVVIDNASHVFNGNENNRSAVRHFLSGLTALRRAVNLLAHVNKITAGANGGANQAVAYSGSTAWSNTVRSRRAQSFDDGRGTVTIAKSNYGPTGTTLRYEWDDLAKLFIPRSVVRREHARDHTEALLAVVRLLEGRLASLSPRAANHLAKLIQAHPECPKGIDLKGLKQWCEQMAVQGRIEEVAVARANRTKGIGYRVAH